MPKTPPTLILHCRKAALFNKAMLEMRTSRIPDLSVSEIQSTNPET